MAYPLPGTDMPALHPDSPARQRSARSWRRRLFAVAAGVVAAPATLELGARLWPGVPPGVAATVSLHDLRFMTRVDPRFGYTLRPGCSDQRLATSDLQVFCATTNAPPWLRDDSLGFRDDFAPLAGAPIVVFGDSFAMGWGVDDGDTLAAVLERQLGVPVHNLGVAGYGPQQALDVLEHVGLSCRPAQVVWVFYGNDLEDAVLYEGWVADRAQTWPSATPKSAFARAINRYSAAYKLFRYVGRHFSADRHRWRGDGVAHLFSPYWRNALDTEQDYVQRGLALTLQQVDRLAALAGEHGVGAVMVAAPYREQVYREEFAMVAGDGPAERRRSDVAAATYARVIAHARDRGVAVLDALPLLREHKAEAIYLYEDPHWSALGTRVVGQALAELLRQRRAR